MTWTSIAGNVGFDDVQEGAELARPMAGEAFADDPAGGGIERREQTEGSVPGVVMRAPLDLARAHGQQGLRSIKRLDLALFVDTQNQRAFWRGQIEPDDGAPFFDERGIGRPRVVTRTWLRPEREFEGLGSCSGRSRRPPILKRFASESAERVAGNEMALDVEHVLDCRMNGQEPLC